MTRADLLDFMRGEPPGRDLELAKELYFLRYPEGRARSAWPGVTYLRLRPTWIRFSDFTADPPRVVAFEFSA